MDQKALTGITLLVIGLFGLVLFFPIFSPATYGGWGCPMFGRRGYGGMMNPSVGPYTESFIGYNMMIFVFDAVFVAILLLGIYFVWKSTQTTRNQ
jgi:hypothetical protein